MRLALWLMKRFAVDPSLTGDLSEEWRSGRSYGWLLRQTLVAIGTTTLAGLWTHKLHTLRAVALGWAIYSGGAFLMMVVSPRYGYLQLLFLSVPKDAMVGWTVARLHPEQPLGAAGLFMGTAVLQAAIAIWRFSSLYPQDFSASFATEQTIVALSAMMAGTLLASRRTTATPVLD